MILCSYILFGALALIVQVVCIREILVVFYGNELCLGIVFACWLIGATLGAALIARRIDRIQRKLTLYLALLMLVALLFPLQISAIRMLRPLLRIPPGVFISPVQLLLGSFLTITPASLLDGMIFPLACALFPKANARPIGRMYVAEAVGSMTAGVLFTFVLVTRFHAFQIAALAGTLTFLMVVLLTAVRRPFHSLASASPKGLSTLKNLAVIGAACYGGALLFAPADTLQAYTLNVRWAAMHPQLERVAAVDSRYQHLALGRQADQYAVFSNGHYAAVFPDDYGAALNAHFVMTQHPQPRNVLVIGGGAEGMLAEILKHPIGRLDYVELDPQWIELIASYLPTSATDALHDPRVTIIYADGRHYVKHATQRYDLVLLNVPDPTNAMLNRFYTLEFFQELRRILQPGGVVITDLRSALHLQADAASYAGSLYVTLGRVFPNVLVTPGNTNFFLASAAPDTITFDLEVLRQRYRERAIDSPYFSQYHYDPLIQPEQIKFVRTTLERGTPSFRVNTDDQPITYFYSLLLWLHYAEASPERVAASSFTRLIRTLAQVRAGWFAAVIGGFILLRCGYLLLAHPSRPSQIRVTCLWLIAASGFIGMALDLILLFAFQSMYGYVYQKIGLIVALFMAGLALGGVWSHRLTSQQKRTHSPEASGLSRLFIMELFTLMFALTLPLWLRLLSHQSAQHLSGLTEFTFMLLVGGIGLLTGLKFPLANALYFQHRRKIGATAALFDSLDHLGASIGSLLVGVVWLPLLGTSASCLLAALLSLSSLCFLIIVLRQANSVI